MKKEIISFQIERPKHRAHRMLFDNNLPFKPQVVKSEKQYNRKTKHRNKNDD